MEGRKEGRAEEEGQTGEVGLGERVRNPLFLSFFLRFLLPSFLSPIWFLPKLFPLLNRRRREKTIVLPRATEGENEISLEV